MDEALMRSKFSEEFPLTKEAFDQLWRDAFIAVDANVLLNLYRYSLPTRTALQGALESVKEPLIYPGGP
jgi:hypothetical protein